MKSIQSTTLPEIRMPRAVAVLARHCAIAALLASQNSSALASCVGDCDSDGSVGLHELVTVVRIALGQGSLASCDAADADGGGGVTIDEVVSAVEKTIDGCPLVSKGEILEIIDETGDGMGNALGAPMGIAVGTSGAVFVVGNNSNNVFRIERDGTIAEVVRGLGTFAYDPDGPLVLPHGIAADSSGDVYVADANARIVRIERAGKVTQIDTGRFSPLVVAVDPAGNVYASVIVGAFPVRGATIRIEADGMLTEFRGAFGFGMAADADGNVYVAEFRSRPFRIEPDGTITEILDETGDGLGNPLSFPIGIAADAAGNVYVAGSMSDNVFRVEPDGAITEIVDETGDGLHPLDHPAGVAVDADGNVFVAGFESDNVLRIEPDGTITEIIDADGDGRGGLLDGPSGVAVDAAGNVYVTGVDSANAFLVPREVLERPL